ncbi:MAG: hypothetical protein ACJAZP_003230 [Psychromonas sp.]|jgi:hypothetical protein|uniref:DUF2914 domain-containing protein n=1 Tax=Psychromonas sp. TaxID=1884585 RepID=UPI0039E3592A
MTPINGSEQHKMKKPEKLTIRINFRREKDKRAENERLGHYHWGRILGVSIVVIVALASLIGAGSYYLNQDHIDSKVIASAADKSITRSPSLMKEEVIETAKPSSREAQIAPAVTIAIEPSAAETASTEITAVEPAAAETPPTEITAVESAVVETVSEDLIAIEPAVAETTPTEITAVEPAAAETPPTEITAVEPAVVETVSEDLTVIEPAAQKNTVSQGLFTQSQKNILSDNVTRFVISQAVESNEPIGTISEIEFDDNNIATVYAYSDVSDLKDQTLYYQWSLNGKNIAKIRVKVGSNRWRSYSSKFIQPHMHGEWKVELQNQAGENIAINQFHY